MGEAFTKQRIERLKHLKKEVAETLLDQKIRLEQVPSGRTWKDTLHLCMQVGAEEEM